MHNCVYTEVGTVPTVHVGNLRRFSEGTATGGGNKLVTKI